MLTGFAYVVKGGLVAWMKGDCQVRAHCYGVQTMYKRKVLQIELSFLQDFVPQENMGPIKILIF
jgi:hypothetical protein